MYILQHKETGAPYTLTFTSHNNEEGVPRFETKKQAKSFRRARRLVKTEFCVVFMTSQELLCLAG